jgi:CO/xanthine dehydrogenase FAD-binding subunit
VEFPGVEIRRRSRPDLLPDGPNPTEEAALALKDRVRFRSLKARVMAEPGVSAALEASKKASTDREMRLALKRHYELLFARMREIEPALENLITEREAEAQAALQEVLPR